MEYELYHWGVKGMKWGVRRKRRNVHEDHVKTHAKKHVSELSTKELKERNNRLQAEQDYARLTKKKNRGAQAVKTFISVAGTIVAAEAAYKTYSRVGNSALDKIGDMVISGIDFSKPFA
jgi:hypothetical protein